MKQLFLGLPNKLEGNIHGKNVFNGYTKYSLEILNLIATSLNKVTFVTDTEFKLPPNSSVTLLNVFTKITENKSSFIWKSLFPLFLKNKSHGFSRDIIFRIMELTQHLDLNKTANLFNTQFNIAFFNRTEFFFFANLPNFKKTKKVFIIHDSLYLRKKSYEGELKTLQPLTLLDLEIEKSLICFADYLICLSEKERDYFSKFFKKNKIFLIKPEIKIPQKKTRFNNNLNICFIGVNNYVNRKTCDNALMRIKKEKLNLKLNLIGNICNNYKDSNPNIIKYGVVKDLNKILNKMDILIAPINSGSGTPIKIADALSSGLLVLTTALGAESYSEFLNKNLFILNKTTLKTIVENTDRFKKIELTSYKKYNLKRVSEFDRLIKKIK